MKNKLFVSPRAHLLGLIILISSACVAQDSDLDKELPNILLIVADDLGYTDIGVFGGEIETPNLDQLAKSGETFTRFHTAPLCAVTRAMLLSGTDNHTAGMGSQDTRTDEYGYEGHLSERIVPLPAVLQEYGYHTSMAGKWHLGKDRAHLPDQKGFNESFVLLDGGGNHYSERGIFGETPISEYRENGEPSSWPQDAYSTDLYTDKLLGYMEEASSQNKPFFAFAAYTSPHWPLQVDSTYWQKYRGQYDQGYEDLREARFQSQKDLGIIPRETELPELHPRVKSWDSLSTEERQIETRKMELYAGMVDNLDANIGRLLNYLRKSGQLENTLVIFMSDNGAAANDFYENKYYGKFLKANYTMDYDEMGKENSFVSYGPQWAEAGAAPFKYFKGYTTEGGTNTPMIISGSALSKNGSRNACFTTLIDIIPTIYELTGITHPQEWKGKPIAKLKGESILPLLEGKTDKIHDADYVFAMEHRGNVVVRKGDWKLINTKRPLKAEHFELYNLNTDLAERNDLRSQQPEKFKELFAEWEKYKAEVKVQNPTPRRSE